MKRKHVGKSMVFWGGLVGLLINLGIFSVNLLRLRLYYNTSFYTILFLIII